MKIDFELFEIVRSYCKTHNEETHNDIDVSDILYSYLHFEKNGFNWDDLYVLNDWNEGESNDPFWDKELNMHSAESFILKQCKFLYNVK